MMFHRNGSFLPLTDLITCLMTSWTLGLSGSKCFYSLFLILPSMTKETPHGELKKQTKKNLTLSIIMYDQYNSHPKYHRKSLTNDNTAPFVLLCETYIWSCRHTSLRSLLVSVVDSQLWGINIPKKMCVRIRFWVRSLTEPCQMKLTQYWKLGVKINITPWRRIIIHKIKRHTTGCISTIYIETVYGVVGIAEYRDSNDELKTSLTLESTYTYFFKSWYNTFFYLNHFFYSLESRNLRTFGHSPILIIFESTFVDKLIGHLKKRGEKNNTILSVLLFKWQNW